jgi:hypothetical protein
MDVHVRNYKEENNSAILNLYIIYVFLNNTKLPAIPSGMLF